MPEPKVSKVLIVADIAGQFDALMRLVAKFPEDMPIVLLGDLVDRGLKSPEVIEWAMKTPRVRALLGNHEHMMIDYYDNFRDGIYGANIWFKNGGTETRDGYSRKYGSARPPEEHLEWLRGLPLYILEEGLLLTHAPLNANFELEEMVEITRICPLRGEWNGRDGTLLWNRSEPKAREGILQVFGHNSHWGLVEQPGWVCLDQSKLEMLTGMLWDPLTKTYDIFTEPYLK